VETLLLLEMRRRTIIAAAQQNRIIKKEISISGMGWGAVHLNIRKMHSRATILWKESKEETTTATRYREMCLFVLSLSARAQLNWVGHEIYKL
jgi:hypothetical protein